MINKDYKIGKVIGVKAKKAASVFIALFLVFLARTFVSADDTTLTIKEDFLPAAYTGEQYEHQLTVENGVPGKNYTFSLVKGSLPQGLSLAENGVVSGIPLYPGFFMEMEFVVTDGENTSAPKNIRMNILSIPVNFMVTNYIHDYNGQPHKATIKGVVTGNSDQVGKELVEGEDFSVLYGTAVSQTNVGEYRINIQISDLRYSVNHIDNQFLIINQLPASISVRVNPSRIILGNDYSIDVTRDPSNLSYATTYMGRAGTSYYSTTTKPTAIGKYTVRVISTDGNYADVVSSADFEIIAPPVNLTVTDNEKIYNGNPQTATVLPTDGADAGKTFKVTYDNLNNPEQQGLTAPTDAGTYRIKVTFDGVYSVGTINTTTFTIRPKSVGFTISDYEKVSLEDDPDTVTYDPTVTPNVEDIVGADELDYTVKYIKTIDTTREQIEHIKGPGVYEIIITCGNSNYTVGTLSPVDRATVTGKKKVSFAVSDNDRIYAPGTVEYRATVQPNIEGFKRYSVTYKKQGDETAEELPFVSQVGVYDVIVEVELDEYILGNDSAVIGTFTLNQCEISFDVTRNKYSFDGTEKAATISPMTGGAPMNNFTAYSVSYGEGESASATGQINVGEYPIIVTLEDDVNCRALPITEKLIISDARDAFSDVIRLEYGNSPAALIFGADSGIAEENRETIWNNFKINHYFNEGEAPKGCEAGVNYTAIRTDGKELYVDADVATVIVKDIKEYTEPGYTTAEGTLITDSTVPKKIADGLYKKTYTEADVTLHRYIIETGKIGDVNGDGYVNVLDANAVLRALAGNNELIPEGAAQARIWDVNKDGKIDSGDESAIRQRYKNPLVLYYPWIEQ